MPNINQRLFSEGENLEEASDYGFLVDGNETFYNNAVYLISRCKRFVSSLIS
jgi:hypothetical protein